MMSASFDDAAGPGPTPPSDPEARLPAGTRVGRGRFEIVEELARGGMAVVYRATDHGMAETEVALKVATAYASRAETAQRYHNEARLATSLRGHPGVVQPLQVGALEGPEGFEGRLYLVTELVPGHALDLVMAGHPHGLDWRRACTLVRDVGRVLVDLHQRGIVHRDVKPANVLLVHEGSATERVCLIDFGLAYATGDGWEEKSPDLTEDGQAPGTVEYMSAQQLAHRSPSPAMDVYALGVTLYELLLGSPPYDKLSVGEMIARKCDPNSRPERLEHILYDLPRGVADLVDRCLSFDPAARPDTAELVAILDAVLEATPRPGLRVVEAEDEDETTTAWNDPDEREESPSAVVAEPPPTQQAPATDPPEPHSPARRMISRRAGAWLLGAAAVTIGALGFAWLGHQGEPSSAEAAPAPAPAPAPALGSAATIPATNDDAVPAAPAAEPSSSGEAIDLGSSTTGDDTVEPPEPAAAETIREQPSPPPSKPHPSKAGRAEACAAREQDARDAAEREQWQHLLRLTKGAKCFDAAERTRLRVIALGETGRYDECIDVGTGSRDPEVTRWVGICKTRQAKENTP